MKYIIRTNAMRKISNDVLYKYTYEQKVNSSNISVMSSSRFNGTTNI